MKLVEAVVLGLVVRVERPNSMLRTLHRAARQQNMTMFIFINRVSNIGKSPPPSRKNTG
jgi:hypothetical protein